MATIPIMGTQRKSGSVVLVNRFRLRPLAGLVLVQQESEQDKDGGHPGKLDVDILEGLHKGLPIELVIDGAESAARAVGPAAEETGERMKLRLVAGAARLHIRLQALLVKERAVGDLRIGDSDQNRAADVAGEVDESGDLVARFFRKADVSSIRNGDEAEG